MCCKIAFYGFYITVWLSIHVDFDAAEIEMLKVKRIACIRSVECSIVNHSDYNSAWNLSRTQPLVNVVSHSVAHRVAFAYHAPDWIFGVANLKGFCLRDVDAWRNVHFSDEQLAFVNFDSKSRVSGV